MQFVNKDYHNEFTNNCNNQISKLNKDIHNSLYELFRIYYILELEYYNKLIEYNISINEFIRNETSIKRIKVSEDKEKDLDFINLINITIDLQKDINLKQTLLNKFQWLANIHYNIFNIIIYAINYEISIKLLKGHYFGFNFIGQIKIIRVPYDSSIPDWGRSLQFRDFLKSQGLEVRTKGSEKGKSWLVDNGLGRSDFAVIRWIKSTSKLSNKTIYRYYPMTRGNIYGKKLEKPFTIEELLEMRNTGIFDKLIHIYKYHYEYCCINYQFINKFAYTNKHNTKDNDNTINL